MLTPITVKCPHCRQVADVFLSTDATFVILNCPGCLRHLIYHENTCAVLNRQQVHCLMDAHLHGTMEQMLLDIVKRARDRVWYQARGRLPRVPSLGVTLSPHDDSREPISPDDILNLRIALATCKDSAEFVAAL